MEEKEYTQEELELAALDEEMKAFDQRTEAAKAKREPSILDKKKEELFLKKLAAENEEKITELSEKYGDLNKKIRRIDVQDGRMIVVKSPDQGTFKRFRDAGKTQSQDLMQLVSPCRIYPDATSYGAILDEFPALLTECANQVCELAGVKIKDSEKK